MKKDEPRFSSGGYVVCKDCPFADESGLPSGTLCAEYGDGCPTEETYAECCRIAEAT